jgi:hypothetical protein
MSGAPAPGDRIDARRAALLAEIEQLEREVAQLTGGGEAARLSDVTRLLVRLRALREERDLLPRQT